MTTNEISLTYLMLLASNGDHGALRRIDVQPWVEAVLHHFRPALRVGQEGLSEIDESMLVLAVERMETALRSGTGALRSLRVLFNVLFAVVDRHKPQVAAGDSGAVAWVQRAEALIGWTSRTE
ncbi:MAG: hypothetical protein HYV09_29345 [Deltaproteobacteria bacterium]|nr:hypothetical protein [Deltaproteobacteria bacterium]